MTVVGRAEIDVSINDRDALAGLERVRAEYRRAMAAIDGDEAVARIDADIRPFERELEKAKRELRELQGQKAQQIRLGIDDKEFNARLEEARLRVKELDGQKARVQIEVEGEKEALAAQQRLQKAEAQRAAANDRLRRGEEAAAKRQAAADLSNEKARMAAINQRARVSSALRRQEATEMARQHSEALAMDRAHTQAIYDQGVGYHKQTNQIIQLQRQYAKLTDTAERLARRRAYTAEGRAKLDLDTRGVAAQMLAIKAELNLLGAHPPVDIKVDVNKKGLAGARQSVLHFFQSIGEKASNLGSMTARIGPFTASLKQIGIALSLLGPSITDIVGALGSLISVTGAGLAGAATVGTAAVGGLAAGFLGMKFSLRNTGAEMTNARAVINAYGKAVEKYGKSSKQAKTAQDQMNHTLATISPLAKNAALGIEAFYTNWDKHTVATQRSFGNIAKNGFKALNDITPMWARSTNQLSNALDKGLRGGFAFISGGEFKRDFQAITGGFNDMVPSLLHAAGSIGRAFLNIGREGSKYLPQLGNSIDNIATKFLNMTQADGFGKRVKGWVDSAKDLAHFFGAAGNFIVHFFSAGVGAGRDMIQTMTQALNRWDAFSKSTSGRNQLQDFFQHSVDGAQQLYSAISPLVKLFALWATGLAPAVKVITAIAAGVTHLAAKIGSLVGLSNPLATLGATLGAAFAIGKIGAFVEALSRIPGLLRASAAAGGGLKVLRDLMTGTTLRDAFKGGGAGAGIEAAGVAAAAEMRAGIVTGGAAAAAELRAAMISGGAAGAGENALSGLLGPNGSPIRSTVAKGAAKEAEAAGESALKTGAKFGAGAAAAEGFTAAIGAMGLAGVAATAGIGALAVGAGFLGYKLLTSKNSTEQAEEAFKKAQKASAAAASTYTNMASSATGVAIAQGQANSSLKDAEKQLHATKAGTVAHRMAMLQYRQAVMDAKNADQAWDNTRRGAQKVADTQLKATKDQVTAYDKEHQSLQKRLQQEKEYGSTQQLRAAAERSLNAIAAKRSTLVNAETVAENRAAAVASNYARIYRGLTPLIGAAEQKIGALARSAPKLAKTVSIKFQASGDVASVAAAASRALNQGVPKRIVTKIVADSKNAEDAINRLNDRANKLHDKKIKLTADAGVANAQVNGLTKRINGVPDSHNTQLKAHDGASGLISGVVSKIKGIPGSHSSNIQAKDNASGIIGRVLGLINSMPASKTTVLTTIHMTKFQTSGSDTRTHGGARAAGGTPTQTGRPTSQQAIDRAAKDAASKQVKKAISQKTTGPQLLVGEERAHPEFVIATNPAYKKNNLRYLAQAAHALGQQIIPAAVGFSGHGAYAEIPKFKDRKAAPRKKFKPAGTNNKSIKGQIKQRRNWTGYIEGLQTAEGDWTSELGIRQDSVREPADMVVQVGTQPVVDKNGKPILDENNQPLTSPVYAENPDIQNQYIPDLQSVLDAFKTLMAILAELVRAIPLAQSSIDIEVGARNQVVKNLNHEIEVNKNRLRGADKDHKQKYRDEITKLERKRDDELGVIKDLKGDRSTLSDSRKEAGFSYRETALQRGQAQQEHDSVLGKAVADAASQTADDYSSAGGGGAPADDSGGGAGGGSTQQDLTYGEQTALADSAKADLYRTFGGNAAATSPMVAGGGASGGGATSPNAAAMPSAPSGAAGGMAAGTMASTGSAAARTISSGSGAARAVIGSMPSAAGVAGIAAVGGGSPTINVTNNYAVAPSDPHTQAKQLEYELGNIL